MNQLNHRFTQRLLKLVQRAHLATALVPRGDLAVDLEVPGAALPLTREHVVSAHARRVPDEEVAILF